MIDFGNMKVDEEKYYSLKQILKDMVTAGEITQEKMNITLKSLAIVNNIVDIDNLQLSNNSLERTITIIPAKPQISNTTSLKEDVSQREKAKGYISLTEIASKCDDERPNTLI